VSFYIFTAIYLVYKLITSSIGSGGTPVQATPQPPANQGYPPAYPLPTPPGAGSYPLPQPVSSGNVDLSNIRPIHSGSVSLGDDKSGRGLVGRSPYDDGRGGECQVKNFSINPFFFQ
jgi:hypothetical protein